MVCLVQGEPSPEKQCPRPSSVHLWWGWGGSSTAQQICGGEEGGSFPGNLCVDGQLFPLVSSCRLRPAYFCVCVYAQGLTFEQLQNWSAIKSILSSLLHRKESMVCTTSTSDSFARSCWWLRTSISLFIWGGKGKSNDTSRHLKCALQTPWWSLHQLLSSS